MVAHIATGAVALVGAGGASPSPLVGVHIITDATFSAVVVMGIVTTMVTPPALKWSLGRAVNRDQGRDTQGGGP